MVDAIQYEHEATFKFIEEVHNCSAVWDVSSLDYKDTKNKQKKIEELADKLGFVQSFLFHQRFLFLLFFFCFTVLRDCHCTKSDILQITVRCDLTRVWHVKVQVCQLFEVCQHEFANLSLPCEGRLRITLVKGSTLGINSLTLNYPLLILVSGCHFFQRWKSPLVFSDYTIKLQYLA